MYGTGRGATQTRARPPIGLAGRPLLAGRKEMMQKHITLYKRSESREKCSPVSLRQQRFCSLTASIDGSTSRRGDIPECGQSRLRTGPKHFTGLWPQHRSTTRPRCFIGSALVSQSNGRRSRTPSYVHGLTSTRPVVKFVDLDAFECFKLLLSA